MDWTTAHAGRSQDETSISQVGGVLSIGQSAPLKLEPILCRSCYIGRGQGRVGAACGFYPSAHTEGRGHLPGGPMQRHDSTKSCACMVIGRHGWACGRAKVSLGHELSGVTFWHNTAGGPVRQQRPVVQRIGLFLSVLPVGEGKRDGYLREARAAVVGIWEISKMGTSVKCSG